MTCPPVPQLRDIRRMRVAVLGPGGVGGLIGALLVEAGHAVTCLAGQTTAQHLTRSGLRVSSDRYGELAVPVRGATVLDDPVDACLITVKATQLHAALDRLPPERLVAALLLLLLNGVEHVELLRARFPMARTVAAAVRVSATRNAPGTVAHHGHLATVDLADDPRGRPVRRGPRAGSPGGTASSRRGRPPGTSCASSPRWPS